MVIYKTENEIINLQEYNEIFKELVEKISNRLFQLFYHTEKLEENYYDVLINEILSTSESIEIYLKANHIIPEEYFDFMGINRCLKETLTANNQYHKERIEMIIDILQKLNKITEFKFKLFADSNNSIEYPKLKEEFINNYKSFEIEYASFRMNYHKLDPDDERGEPLLGFLYNEFMEE